MADIKKIGSNELSTYSIYFEDGSNDLYKNNSGKKCFISSQYDKINKIFDNNKNTFDTKLNNISANTNISNINNYTIKLDAEYGG